MTMLAEPLDRLLADLCPRDKLRDLHRGESIAPLWPAAAALGYQDALVPESAGGLGLALPDLADMMHVAGRRLCPVPLGETIVAHALLAAAGVERPQGPILLLTPCREDAGADSAIVAQAVPLALAAQHALVDLGDRHVLLPVPAARLEPLAPGRSLAADLAWDTLPRDVPTIAEPSGPLRSIAAVLRAGAIAGMAAAILKMTVDYAATRQQFGKSIADFQAVQQQLAVMAEEVAAAQMAVAIGYGGPALAVAPIHAAIAKMRCSEAAARVIAIGHAVHGAIGISEEYDLQLFTHRLAEERLADGAETYWAEQAGRARLAAASKPSVAFAREAIG